MTDTIRLKGIKQEDFINYKKPSLFLGTCFCDLKCCKEKGYDYSVCQNSETLNIKESTFNISSIYKLYIDNDIEESIVIGGMEPMLQIDEIISLIDFFRNKGCNDDFVIYTGYTEEEVKSNQDWSKLLNYNNLIIKYGRFVLGDSLHYDEVLGVSLASNNQYAKKY